MQWRRGSKGHTAWCLRSAPRSRPHNQHTPTCLLYIGLQSRLRFHRQQSCVPDLFRMPALRICWLDCVARCQQMHGGGCAAYWSSGDQPTTMAKCSKRCSDHWCCWPSLLSTKRLVQALCSSVQQAWSARHAGQHAAGLHVMRHAASSLRQLALCEVNSSGLNQGLSLIAFFSWTGTHSPSNPDHLSPAAARPIR